MGSPSFAILVFSKNREFFNIFSPKYTAADTFQQKKGLLLNFRFATAPYILSLFYPGVRVHFPRKS